MAMKHAERTPTRATSRNQTVALDLTSSDRRIGVTCPARSRERDRGHAGSPDECSVALGDGDRLGQFASVHRDHVVTAAGLARRVKGTRRCTGYMPAADVLGV